MNRGDHQEDIFRDDQDRRTFLDTLAEACGKIAETSQQLAHIVRRVSPLKAPPGKALFQNVNAVNSLLTLC